MVDVVLRAHPGKWETDSETDYSFEWQRCDRDGENCESVGDNEANESGSLRLSEEDVGERLRVKVTATNASGSTDAASAATSVVTVADAPDVDEQPKLYKVWDEYAPMLPGYVLGSSDRDSGWYPWPRPELAYELGGTPEAEGIEHQWLRCAPDGSACTPIVGATDSQYRLELADQGHRLRVRVTGTNTSGSIATVSEPSEIVDELQAPDLDQPIAAPWQPYQNLYERQLLSAPGSSWGPSSGNVVLLYQWLRCDSEGESCSAIGDSSESGAYYTTSDDVGSRIRVRVTATNDAGEASATSDPSEIVRPEEAPVIGVMSWNEWATYAEGVELWAPWVPLNEGADNDWVRNGFTLQWLRCDSAGSNCGEIPDATESYYMPVSADVGHTVRLRVEAENAAGSDQATTDPSPVIDTAPPPPDPPDPPAPPGPVVVQSTGPVVNLYVAGHSLSADPRGGEPWQWNQARDWQWQRCDADGNHCSDIPGAGGRAWAYAQYLPRWADVGSRLRVLVSHSTPDGELVRASDVTPVIAAPGPPRNHVLPVISGVARARERFHATTGGWVPGEIQTELQWLRCDASGGDCTEIAGAHRNTYDSSNDDLGRTLRVRVTGTSSEGSTSVESQPTAPLAAASEPENQQVPAITGNVQVGEVLGGDMGAWVGARPLGLSMHWLRCDEDGANCAAIPDTRHLTYEIGDADIGSTLRFEVTASNDLGTVSVASDQTTEIPMPDPPANTSPPTVTGAPDSGEVLSGQPGTWTNHPSSLSYQWQSCDEDGEDCTDLTGSTFRDYEVQSANAGSRIRLEVTATNSGGQTDAWSEPSDVVDPMESPSNVIEPVVSGSPRETLPTDADPGEWSGGKPRSYVYQWLECDQDGLDCAEIDGATEKAYVPSADDLDHTLKVRVTVTNAAGSNAVTSAASDVVSRSAPVFLDRPRIEGPPREGQELSVSTDGLRGSPSIDLSYTWQVCDDGCVEVAGATGSTYEPAAADVGSAVRVIVTAANDLGSATSRTATVGSITGQPADGPTVTETPHLGGIPRVTETLETTDGAWTGSGEVSTEIQWQRCSQGPQTCEDISGATGSSYELVAGDQDTRLRTEVMGTDSQGTTTAFSPLSPRILPEVDTLFVLDDAVSLADVTDAIDAADAQLISLDYSDGSGSTGSYAAGKPVSGAEARQAITQQSGVDDQAPVKRFALRGAVADQDLGGLAGHPHQTAFVPSQRGADASGDINLNPNPANSAGNTEPGGHGLFSHAALRAFDDSYGFCGPFLRCMRAEFTWDSNAEQIEKLEAIAGNPLALEFDVKLYQPDNPTPLGIGNPFCWPGDDDNFWIDDRDDSLKWTDIPDDAGFYWESATASDECSVKDLSFGIYHPENLEQGMTYGVEITFTGSFSIIGGGLWNAGEAAGEKSSSPVSWSYSLLGEGCGLGIADITIDWPYCVNITGDHGFQGDSFLQENLDADPDQRDNPADEPENPRFPGCYTYEKDRVPQVNGVDPFCVIYS